MNKKQHKSFDIKGVNPRVLLLLYILLGLLTIGVLKLF